MTDRMIMASKSDSLFEGLVYTFREEGIAHVGNKLNSVLKRTISSKLSPSWDQDNFLVDVLFINGCDYSVPHPIRYRVAHQIEQLHAAGMTAAQVDAWNLSDSYLRNARTFIIFRCPCTDEIESFIVKAKRLNKRVIYDIDDLVIDTSYTDLIPFVQRMPLEDKAAYDDGVRRMGRTLSLCDCAITSTEALAEELRKYVPRVYVNRNTASESMLDYSNRAVYRRDILPTLAASEISWKDRKIYKLAKQRMHARNSGEAITIGYFSGSITHNADIELVLPALVDIMDADPRVNLLLSGEIDASHELSRFGTRVKTAPFCDWRRLPELIGACDISIAPLEDTLFNRAKSENKWVEASLVRVPTVASSVGAFKRMIQDGVTGFLCSDLESWRSTLLKLITSADLRHRVADNAFKFCLENCTTVGAAKNLRDIILSEQTPNLMMALPSLNTSGGVLVALRHCSMLQEAGYDVWIANTDGKQKWIDAFECKLPVLNRTVRSGEVDGCPFTASIDVGVATLWDTLDFVKRYSRIGKVKYLVQNFETDFYLPGNPLRVQANATYLEHRGVDYLTISPWCREWLVERFGQVCQLVPNGIDVEAFSPIRRDYSTGKIRILIEGDCGSEYKNVDEAFRIVERLDPNKYEIWYMSYTGTTKPFYRIDVNLGSVPHEKVADVYRQCHILLKTSILESFSYPPLEMMATGGQVVAVPNGGNAEFLRNEENCLLYAQGDLKSGAEAIERLVDDGPLRDKLYQNGIDTAVVRDWRVLKNEIIRLYS